MNIHQFVATTVEVVVIVSAVVSVLYTMHAHSEAKKSFEYALTILTTDEPAPALDVADDFINNFIEGAFEDPLREKYGRGFTD